MALEQAPAKAKVTDPGGMLTREWVKWFQSMFVRIGGHNSRNLDTIDAESTANATAITTLQSTTSTHTSQISTLQTQINDILQGRQL